MARRGVSGDSFGGDAGEVGPGERFTPTPQAPAPPDLSVGVARTFATFTTSPGRLSMPSMCGTDVRAAPARCTLRLHKQFRVDLSSVTLNPDSL